MVSKFEDDQITIGNKNAELLPSTLLLGSGTKSGDGDMIGQHGEGYKLAMVALLREGFDVEVANNGKWWKPLMEYSETFGEQSLVVHERPMEEEQETPGLFFRISGDCRDIREKLEESYLSEGCHESRILGLAPEGVDGKVYVGGLLVSSVANLRCSYNFAPNAISLDRDRRMLHTWDVAYETSRLWNIIDTDEELLQKLIEEDAPDVSRLADAVDITYAVSGESTAPAYRSASHYAVRWQKENPKTFPVSSQEEAEQARSLGYKVRIVSKSMKKLLKKTIGFFVPAAGAPRQRLQNIYDKIKYMLDEDQKQEFLDILEQLE